MHTDWFIGFDFRPVFLASAIAFRIASTAHEYAAATTPALKTIRLRAIKLHEQMRDADLTLSAFNAERSINKIDAELARRDEYLNAIGKAPSPHPLPQEK